MFSLGLLEWSLMPWLCRHTGCTDKYLPPRSNTAGSVNPTFKTDAATPVLNCCSAAFRGCEFDKVTGKPQATGLHQSPHHPFCHHFCSDPTSPGIGTCQHKGWQGAQRCRGAPEGLPTCSAHGSGAVTTGQWLSALSHTPQTSSQQLLQFLFPGHPLPFIFPFDYK